MEEETVSDSEQQSDPVRSNGSTRPKRSNKEYVVVPSHIPLIGGKMIPKDGKANGSQLERSRIRDIVGNPIMMIQEMNRYLDLKKALEELRNEYERNVKVEEEELKRKEEERDALEKLRIERELQMKMEEEARQREEAQRREEMERLKKLELERLEEARRRKEEEERVREEELRAKLAKPKLEKTDQLEIVAEVVDQQPKKPVEEAKRGEEKSSKAAKIIDSMNERLEKFAAKGGRTNDVMRAVAQARRRQLLPIDRVNVNGYLFDMKDGDGNVDETAIYYQPDTAKFEISYDQGLLITDSAPNKRSMMSKTSSMPLHHHQQQPLSPTKDSRPVTERKTKSLYASQRSYSPVRPQSQASEPHPPPPSSSRAKLPRSMTEASSSTSSSSGRRMKSSKVRSYSPIHSVDNQPEKIVSQFSSSRKLFIPSMSLADDQILARFSMGSSLGKSSSMKKLGPIAVRDFKGEAEDEKTLARSKTASPIDPIPVNDGQEVTAEERPIEDEEKEGKEGENEDRPTTMQTESESLKIDKSFSFEDGSIKIATDDNDDDMHTISTLEASVKAEEDGLFPSRAIRSAAGGKSLELLQK